MLLLRLSVSRQHCTSLSMKQSKHSNNLKHYEINTIIYEFSGVYVLVYKMQLELNLMFPV